MLTKEECSEMGSHQNYTVLMSILGLSLSSDMDLGMSLARPVPFKAPQQGHENQEESQRQCQESRQGKNEGAA